MIIEPGSKLIFIGDSITDGARNMDLNGEGRLDEAYGSSYTNLVRGWLHAVYPERRIRLINKGVSGHTVRDLAGRWTEDVLELEPDWVSLMIGVNDVWRQFDTPLIPEQHVPIEEYATTLERLVVQTLPHVEGMILMTPFHIEAHLEDAMRKCMDEYGEVVRGLARKHATLLTDTQAAFEGYLSVHHSASTAWDRVHPDVIGHTILARAWLNTVGFDWRAT